MKKFQFNIIILFSLIPGIAGPLRADDLPAQSWGYLNSSGKWVIEPRFQKAEPFHNGLARVIVDNKFAYINKMGALRLGPGLRK